MIKSPLRYPGGKSRAVEFLSQFIPPFEEMREVFFGGGSFTFYCVQKFANKIYRASDLNYELYCFWAELQANPNELIDGVQKVYDTYKFKSNDSNNGKDLFQLILSRRNSELSELARAIDFYLLNRITYSGVVDSGGFSSASYDGRFTQTSIDRLRLAHRVIKNVSFICGDYSALLNEGGTNVFIFLDPPYYSATKSKLYGKNGLLHTLFDHQLLFEELIKCPHKWLVTYDNSEYIKKLYDAPGIYQKTWKLQYGMTMRNNASDDDKNELLIANYNLEAMLEKNLKKVPDSVLLF